MRIGLITLHNVRVFLLIRDKGDKRIAPDRGFKGHEVCYRYPSTGLY